MQHFTQPPSQLRLDHMGQGMGAMNRRPSSLGSNPMKPHHFDTQHDAGMGPFMGADVSSGWGHKVQHSGAQDSGHMNFMDQSMNVPNSLHLDSLAMHPPANSMPASQASMGSSMSSPMPAFSGKVPSQVSSKGQGEARQSNTTIQNLVALNSAYQQLLASSNMKGQGQVSQPQPVQQSPRETPSTSEGSWFMGNSGNNRTMSSSYSSQQASGRDMSLDNQLAFHREHEQRIQQRMLMQQQPHGGQHPGQQQQQQYMPPTSQQGFAPSGGSGQFGGGFQQQVPMLPVNGGYFEGHNGQFPGEVGAKRKHMDDGMFGMQGPMHGGMHPMAMWDDAQAWTSRFPPGFDGGRLPWRSAKRATEQICNLHLRKRQQVQRACLLCRQSKLKCDDQRPCSRCVKRGTEGGCVSWEGVKNANKGEAKPEAPSASSDTSDAVNSDEMGTSESTPAPYSAADDGSGTGGSPPVAKDTPADKVPESGVATARAQEAYAH